MKTHIEFKNGKPFISVDGNLHYPLAYTTYFEECGEFSDFISHGYKMFFINVSFTDLPINNITGFSPFRTGVFEGEEPDYSEFDSIVSTIISKCPDALIFPRINISMPRKWLQAHPYETVITKNGGARESFYSDVFLCDGAELLRTLVAHIRSSHYSSRIAGYQVCGGTTQEWFHHDLFGSFSPLALQKFREWMYERYSIENATMPDKEDFSNGVFTESVQKYAEFCSEFSARAVEYFARILKECINNEQLVGAFYGYNAFVSDYLWGTHGLRHIIASPYIDFFSSPCCYDVSRSLGVDWGDMLPVDSIKAHGKLCFIECDIRTSLTKRMQASRPNEYPDNIYSLTDENGNKTAWCGPETVELSISAISKAFAHQLTKGSGVWWFDMWGGWYHNPEIMATLEQMKNIAEASKNKKVNAYPCAEVALFIDESAYANLPRGKALADSVNAIRVAMGNTGIPFDICMVEDAHKLLHKYRFAIFTAPIPSESGETAVELCKKMKLAYVQSSEEKPFFSTDELRSILIEKDIHCYNSENCVVYVGGGFIGIHSTKEGTVKIALPKKYKVKALLGAGLPQCEADEITIPMKKYDTAIFELI